MRAGICFRDGREPYGFRFKNYRFFFFSREEKRMHIHVICPSGQAKFWVEPVVKLAHNEDLTRRQILELEKIIEKQKNEIVKAWKKHFEC